MEEQKKTVEVTEYTCSFCYGVKSYSKKKIERHEKKCASRPFALTPYEWGEKELDDRGIGQYAEELLRDAVSQTPKQDGWSHDGSQIELDYPYLRTEKWYARDYLEVRARDVEDVLKILKSPAFMEQVQKRADEMREKAIKLIADFAKKAKLEIPVELEEKDDVAGDVELMEVR